jgi:hypothetical protein
MTFPNTLAIEPMEKLYTISKHPDLDEMFDYLEEQLPKGSMESIEVHLLECEACASALEAMDRAGGPTAENRESAARFQEAFLSGSDLSGSEPKTPTGSGKGWNVFFRAAAVILLAVNIGLVGWYFSGNNNPSAFSPYEAGTDRGPETSDLDAALNSYKKGDFNAAVALLNKIPDSPETVELKLLYLGNALLALDRNSEALVPLKRLHENPDWVLYHQEASHYLGIAYMRLGQSEK